MILIGDWHKIPTHQSMTYLNSMCKSYKSSKFIDKSHILSSADRKYYYI